MIQTNIPCRSCREPMIGIEFARHTRVVCDKLGCPLYREGQGCIEKEIRLEPVDIFMPAPLPKTPPRGRLISKKKARKKTIRRKGLVYARKAI